MGVQVDGQKVPLGDWLAGRPRFGSRVAWWLWWDLDELSQRPLRPPDQCISGSHKGLKEESRAES